MPVDLGIERGAWGKYVGSVAMVARLEDPQAAVLQPDLHFSGEDENPLRLRRAVELAAKADRALAQLIAGRGEYRDSIVCGVPAANGTRSSRNFARPSRSV